MERYPLKLDLTSNKIAWISDRTIEYLKGVDRIELVVMSDGKHIIRPTLIIKKKLLSFLEKSTLCTRQNQG